MSGAEVFLKLETLQPTFSYKIRGAFNAVMKLAGESAGTPPPLVTASAGNHGRALAHAARAAGMRLTVYVPSTAPEVKLAAIRQEGAELRTCADYDDAERRAKEHGTSGTALYISPYSHPDVIAGAGTVGLEILEDQPDIDTIVVPVGGGGLVGGIAVAARALSGASVIGVEVEASSPFSASLAAGRIVSIDVQPTLADGLSGNLDPDTVTFDLVRRLVSRIAIVSESHLEEAVVGTVVEERLVAEGAGAAGVAALLAGQIEGNGRPVAVVLSGANIDPAKLTRLLSRRT